MLGGGFRNGYFKFAISRRLRFLSLKHLLWVQIVLSSLRVYDIGERGPLVRTVHSEYSLVSSARQLLVSALLPEPQPPNDLSHLDIHAVAYVEAVVPALRRVVLRWYIARIPYATTSFTFLSPLTCQEGAFSFLFLPSLGISYLIAYSFPRWHSPFTGAITGEWL